MIKWVKPNGSIIETNETNGAIEGAVAAGWKQYKAPAVDPDKGDGVPGSAEWHKTQIMGSETKEEVADYLKTIGVSIDMRGGLDRVKEKALNALEG